MIFFIILSSDITKHSEIYFSHELRMDRERDNFIHFLVLFKGLKFFGWLSIQCFTLSITRVLIDFSDWIIFSSTRTVSFTCMWCKKEEEKNIFHVYVDFMWRKFDYISECSLWHHEITFFIHYYFQLDSTAAVALGVDRELIAINTKKIDERFVS